MNIVCATDNRFIQHCCVMLASVLTNNRNVIIYLLSEGLTKENQQIIREEIESKSGIFYYIIVDSFIISKFPMPNTGILKHISPATYYRLLMPDLLPKDIHKVIYLDCDIIVRKSIEDLWNTDITDFAIGSVRQVYEEILNAERLGYPVKYGYFNAGVLLINLDFWRTNKIQPKLINYLINNYQNVIYHDQDALNANLYDQARILPCKWNMLSFFFQRAALKTVGVFHGEIIEDYVEYKRMLINDRKDPAVIHYVSYPKPWQHYCWHPFAYEYFHYARKTVMFKNIQEPNKFLQPIYAYYVYVNYAIKDLLRPLYRKIIGQTRNYV